jgi:amino acid adenylation domain-containing protein
MKQGVKSQMQKSAAMMESIPERISRVALSSPQSTALTDRSEQMSFRELDLRATRFAGYLANIGIVSGTTVAICMERSFDWIVAALGAMRAGCAYVPLDAALPESRLRFVIEDSGAAAVVGHRGLLDRLCGDARGIDPCRDAHAIAAAPVIAFPPIDPESLAYLIYTSGSTGVPKGVEITHANLAHLVRWHQNAFAVTCQDRASQLAGLGFDAAVWDIWPNLCAGAAVCLSVEEIRSSPELIQEWIIREQVTIAFVPTVHVPALMAMHWPAASSLRLLLTGGDTLHHGPPSGLPFEIVNNYGPTECTVVATSAPLVPGTHAIPPIGHPIKGATVYLLNEAFEAVGDGCVGEIFIAGSGVGRGYRNLPDATSRCFVTDTISRTPGARMYRTGDRGLRLPDGQIEFRGRMDRQTKIRGHRIELDEIGSVLSQHPSVEFAAAMSTSPEGGENKLVAYVLLREQTPAPNAKDLRDHLQRSLPEYMIPSTYMRIDAIPLSANEKVDYSRLADSANLRPLEERVSRAPSTLAEKKLISIIRELLENESIAVDDNFFLAGGHSLLGMQLLMRLRAAFDVDFTLQQLFEAPTVEQLALTLAMSQAAERLSPIWADLLGRKHVGLDQNFFELGGHPALVAELRDRIAAEFGQNVPISLLFQHPTVRSQAEHTVRIEQSDPVLPHGVLLLQAYGNRPAIFWVHFLNVSLAKELGQDQPIYLVTLTRSDIAELGVRPALKTIASRLVAKIVAAQPEGPYNIGGLCIGSVLAFEVSRQLREAGHEVALLVLLDAPSPLYLESYNSLAATLARPRYRVERMARLGMRQTLFNFRKRLIKFRAGSKKSRFAWKEINDAHELIESAAFEYKPERYEGKVLLLLASEPTPHGDFLPGWQAVIPFNLETRYIHGHHRELMASPGNARDIAETILSQLTLAVSEQEPLHV